jgi:hypothetical protein
MDHAKIDKIGFYCWLLLLFQSRREGLRDTAPSAPSCMNQELVEGSQTRSRKE